MAGDEEHVILEPNTLVLYVDDTGDEKFGDPAHPVFAFGGVACVSDYMDKITNDWRSMKASVFPQVKSALHAKEHLKEVRLKGVRRASVLSAMSHPGLARFGMVLTSKTVVPRDLIMASATASLTMRFDQVVNGLAAKGWWSPGGKVMLVFEASNRLEKAIEGHLGQLSYTLGDQKFPIDKAFMPKFVADPLLEMADFVAYTVGRNVRFQMQNGPYSCTENFDVLFRKFDPAMTSFMVAESIKFEAAPG